MNERWSIHDLRAELQRFEADLRAAGLKDNTVRTYVNRSDVFLRWLIGEYRPRGPND